MRPGAGSWKRVRQQRSETAVKSFRLFALIAAVMICRIPDSSAQDLPVCLTCDGCPSIESLIAASKVAERELLSRLVYAESASTGSADDPNVYEAIAWGVMNRVRLGEASGSMRGVYGEGVRGVIFKKGQFNPAVSRRSQFSKEFLCPRSAPRWAMACRAAEVALNGSDNPFIQTPWEKEHGVSLVVNFYYPLSVQAKAPTAPWESSRGLRFIGDVLINGQVLPSEQVRFYRLTRPPADIRGRN